MSRKLEKFIGDNRNEFDDQLPSGKVWENIAAGFAEPKKKKALLAPLYKWSIAAAILITVVVTALILLNQTKKGPVEIVQTPLIDTNSNTIAPEYSSEVNEFAKLVMLKQEELKALAPEQPALYQKFTSDITQLDSSYKSLKSQLDSTLNRELLLEAMIQNLQLQLNVLNQQLNIINQIKQSKKEGHEKNNQII